MPLPIKDASVTQDQSILSFIPKILIDCINSYMPGIACDENAMGSNINKFPTFMKHSLVEKTLIINSQYINVELQLW